MREPNPPRVTLEELNAEQTQRVVRLGLLVVQELAKENNYGAFEMVEMASMEAEEWTAFWSLLDSSQRTLIKEMGELAK